MAYKHRIPYMERANPYTVAVLGGMGSYSTLHFFQSLLEAFPAEKEWQRPRVVIDNDCVLPSRVRAILYEEGREELVAGMIEALDKLQRYDPHAVVMPCNTAHAFLPEIRARGGAVDQVVDILELAAHECARAGGEALLLATEGTVASKVYEPYCANAGVSVRYPEASAQRRLRAFIEQVKRADGVDADGFRAFLDTLDAATVILGCTELSSLAKKMSTQPSATLIDPLALAVAELRSQSDALATADQSSSPKST